MLQFLKVYVCSCMNSRSVISEGDRLRPYSVRLHDSILAMDASASTEVGFIAFQIAGNALAYLKLWKTHDWCLEAATLVDMVGGIQPYFF